MSFACKPLFLLGLLFYVNGAVAQEQPKVETEKIYTYVEKMPVFPGGQDALMEHIAKNLRYPQAALQARLEGRVFVNFIVSTTGKVEQIKVIKGVHPLLDNEAIQVIGMLPAFEPGFQSGRAVAVSFTVPIQFKLTYNAKQALNKRGQPQTPVGTAWAVQPGANTEAGESTTVQGHLLYGTPGSLERQVHDQLSTFQYPTEALRQHLEGRVMVAFKVDSLGNVRQSRILRGVHPTLDQAAQTAVASSASLAFKQAKVQAGPEYIVPVLFQLPPRADELLAQRMAEDARTPSTAFSPAQYPGGPEALHAFLAAAPYPEAARKELLSGRIFITINLDANGWVKTMEPMLSDAPTDGPTATAKARRKALEDLYESALQYLTQMPQWQPARWNGQGGTATYTLPLTYHALPPATPSPVVYAYADEMPVPPSPNIFQASSHHLIYPAAALRAQAQGIVWVYCVVDETGKLTQPAVVKTPHSSLSEEAIKLVNGLPSYKPGKHRGQPVKVAMMIPVTFSIH